MISHVWKASTLLLAGTLALVVGGSGSVGSASADPQPHMKAALGTLKIARTQLEKATSDKGGHRVKALALTNEAIEQVEKGIAFDDAH